ncbi:hypothetical protein ACFWR9_16525 [Streptomyces sp. NPDC058534]|uniref:hypothetical protein n=1 Tax=Streptomyces sp. NPDC058534 TaxID=3346541 RepID=UPI0036496576
MQLRPDRLAGLVRADTGSGLVTVRAGMPLHRLPRFSPSSDRLWRSSATSTARPRPAR